MQILVGFLTLFLLFGTVVAGIRSPSWWIKLFAGSRHHIAGILAFLIPATIYYYKAVWGWHLVPLTGLMVLAIAYHLRYILPFTPLAKPTVQKATDQGKSTSILVANVRQKNKDYKKLFEMIKQQKPDVVGLTETNQRWVDEVDNALKEDYKYKVLHPQENTYGMALFSKYELQESSVQFLVEDDIPSIHARLVLDETTQVQFMLLHPRPPAPWTHPKNKDMELIKVAARSNWNNRPSIVCGDLNDVGWSSITRRFKAVSNMRDPRIGRGFFNTYNANIPFMRYPIDHIFLSEEFQLVQMERLGHFGSDHFPIFIKIKLQLP